MRHLFAAALASSAICGALATGACASPTYTTRHGLRVYDKTPTGVAAPDVEAVSERVARELGKAAALDGVDVYLLPHPIEIDQQDGRVTKTDGYTNMLDNQVVATVLTECLWVSGLVHELAHVIHDRGLLAPDWFHDDAPFWEKVTALEATLREECTPEQLAADADARKAAGLRAVEPAPEPSEGAPAGAPSEGAPGGEDPSPVPQAPPSGGDGGEGGESNEGGLGAEGAPPTG